MNILKQNGSSIQAVTEAIRQLEVGVIHEISIAVNFKAKILE